MKLHNKMFLAALFLIIVQFVLAAAFHLYMGVIGIIAIVLAIWGIVDWVKYRRSLKS